MKSAGALQYFTAFLESSHTALACVSLAVTRSERSRALLLACAVAVTTTV